MLQIASIRLMILALALASVGCQGLTPGKAEWVRADSDQPRAGNVYLIRGLIGVFSTGMDDLAVKLNERGIRAHVFQDAQHSLLSDAIIRNYRDKPNREPLVLIGHSYGADGVVRAARAVGEKGIEVDLLITLDPTIPPNVPRNVKATYDFFQPQPTDFIPLFRGVPLKQDPDATGKLVNIDLRKDRRDLLDAGTNHINIDKSPKVHEEILRLVMEVCPPRNEWLARRGLPPAPPNPAPASAGNPGGSK